MRIFIVNVGHETRAGTTLDYAGVEKEFQKRGFVVHSHYVTGGTYEGKQESTSVLRVELPRDNQHDEKVFWFLSTALDQECIAVAEIGAASIGGASTATGKLYGANPKGYAFDWAQFRI